MGLDTRGHIYGVGAGVRPREKAGRTMVGFGEGRNVGFAPSHYEEYLAALVEPRQPVWGTPVRLKKGTPAWAVKDEANGLLCLVSYYTVVSFKAGNAVRHLGKWSMTTTRHQKMFADEYGNG